MGTTDHGPRTTKRHELSIHQSSLVVAVVGGGAVDSLADVEIGRADRRLAARDGVLPPASGGAGADSGDCRAAMETSPGGNECLFPARPIGQHPAGTAGGGAALRVQSRPVEKTD